MRAANQHRTRAAPETGEPPRRLGLASRRRGVRHFVSPVAICIWMTATGACSAPSFLPDAIDDVARDAFMDAADGCAMDASACRGTCVDLTSDATNCGECGRACASDQVCVAGSCACAAMDRVACGTGCVDTRIDRRNCGRCDSACPSGSICFAGACTCPQGAGWEICGGQCANTETSGEHCGACGSACPTRCEAGHCLRARRLGTTQDQSMCAVMDDGTVRCWGDNSNSQLGDGFSAFMVVRPSLVSGLTAVREIAVWVGGGCALHEGGTVSCWGSNGTGSLGDGTRVNRYAPAPVPGLDRVTAIWTPGATWYALREDGSVWCWGYNNWRDCGDDTRQDWLRAAPIAGVDNAVRVTGARGRYVVRRDGSVLAWGLRPYFYDTDVTLSPTLVTEVSGVRDFVVTAAGCLMFANGNFACLGDNSEGEVGDGTTTHRLHPVSVALPGEVEAVSTGGWNVCAFASGALWCWGGNAFGMLGVPAATTFVSSPRRMSLTGVAQVSIGTGFMCVLFGDGRVQCAGNGRRGQLGDGLLGARGTFVDVAW